MMLIQSFKLLYLKYWIEKGFFGAKLFITKPFSSDYERQEFESTIQDLKGSENSSVLLLEANLESDNLAEHILIQNIDTNIDDTLFQSTEESSARNVKHLVYLVFY
jgi:hypothetical protein